MHCNAGNGFKLQILWTDVRWLSIELRLAESRWVARRSEANIKNCFIEIRRSLDVKEMYKVDQIKFSFLFGCFEMAF